MSQSRKHARFARRDIHPAVQADDCQPEAFFSQARVGTDVHVPAFLPSQQQVPFLLGRLHLHAPYHRRPRRLDALL